MIKLNKTEALQWQNEALTVKGQSLFLCLENELAEKENVTEALKGDNAMEWVRKMNNIRNRAVEVVNTEIIYN